MKVEVKLFAYFRDNRFIRKSFEYTDKMTVRRVIEQLSINLDEVGVTLLNGRHCQLDTELKENDSLGIFPMIGGG